MSKQEKGNWKKRALGELKSLSVTVAYIWVLLSTFSLYRMMILSEHQIDFPIRFGLTLVNALVFAKFIWLAELLHAGRAASGKPLLQSAFLNAGIFSVILMVCHEVEEFALRWWHAGSAGVAAANPEKLSEVVITVILIFVVLIPFFLARGLVEILGTAEMRRLLLVARSKEAAAPAAHA